MHTSNRSKTRVYLASTTGDSLFVMFQTLGTVWSHWRASLLSDGTTASPLICSTPFVSRTSDCFIQGSTYWAGRLLIYTFTTIMGWESVVFPMMGWESVVFPMMGWESVVFPMMGWESVVFPMHTHSFIVIVIRVFENVGDFIYCAINAVYLKW